MINWHLLVPRLGPGPDWGAGKLTGFGCALAAALGEPVRVLAVPDVAVALDEFGRQAPALAWARPLDVLAARAVSSGRVVAFAEFEGSGWFRPLVVARPADSGAVPPWPGAPEGSRIAMGIDAQLAQWIIPCEAAMRQGIRVQDHFHVRRDPSPAVAMRAVLDGDVDYGATYDRALRAFLRRGDVDAAGLAIAWASDPVPYDAIMASKYLSPADQARLRRAILSPLDGRFDGLPPGYTGFSLARNDDYDVLAQRVGAFSVSR